RWPARGRAQSRTENRYGRPADVLISDLAQGPSSYYDQLIRTKGRLNTEAGLSRNYLLQDDFGNTVRIIPSSEVGMEFDERAHKLIGRSLEVVGIFRQLSGGVAQMQMGGVAVAGVIEFMEFTGPPEERKGELKAPG